MGDEYAQDLNIKLPTVIKKICFFNDIKLKRKHQIISHREKVINLNSINHKTNILKFYQIHLCTK